MADLTFDACLLLFNTPPQVWVERMEPRAPPTSGGGSHLNAAPSAVVIPFGRPANKSWTEPSSSAAQVGSSSSAAAESVPDWWSAEVGEDELVYPHPNPNPNPTPRPRPYPTPNQVGEDELVYTTTPFSVGGPTRAVGKGQGKGKGELKGKAKGQAKGGRGAGAAAPAGGRGAAAAGGRDAESAVGKGRDAAAGGKGAAAAGGSGAEPAGGLPKGRKRKAKAHKAKGADADEELVYTTTPFSVDVASADRPRKAPRAADTGIEGARKGPRAADVEGARKGPRTPSEIEGARKAPRATTTTTTTTTTGPRATDVEGARAQRRRLEPDRQTGAETDSQAGRAPISPRPSAAAERRGQELQRRSERVCSFFAQGRCRNGDACRFSP